ncbi:transposase [Paludisphaera sp.]|uniref:transposase n=1 Tax=Paludisphaera sp. TaxID=2017432 RepID=UPI00301E1129
MERQTWLYIRALAVDVCSKIEHPGVRYSDRWILLVYMWAVVHDRPVYWACRPRNWPADPRPVRLPSQPTMSRRLRSPAFLWVLALMLERLGGGSPAPGGPGPARRAFRQGLLKVVDGLPLRVGGFGKDRSARTGRGAGGWYRGYKPHALWGSAPAPLAWSVRPANESESTVARGLLARLDGFGYVLGDSIFDCNALYDAAMERGHQLIAPKKRRGAGLGHHDQSEARLRGLELLETPYGRSLYAERALIERHFGDLTSRQGVSMLPH